MSTPKDPHLGQPVFASGAPVVSASGAIVAVHGRGASAQDILMLAEEITVPEIAVVAPQADGNTWYPNRFLVPIEQNEPWLSSALATLDRVISLLVENGVPAERTIVLGFSQGACLAAEFVARNAKRYGGVLIFSGGLIGPPGTPRNYPGSLDGTPVFLGCSDVDPHIPVERVHETAEILRTMGGAVDTRIYPGLGHTVNRDELQFAREIVKRMLAADHSGS